MTTRQESGYYASGYAEGRKLVYLEMLRQAIKGLGRRLTKHGEVDMKETMTVGQLRKELEAYPDDAPVFCEWEGVLAPIKPRNFAEEAFSNTDLTKCIIIDVNGY